jgi:hypothetical protein
MSDDTHVTDVGRFVHQGPDLVCRVQSGKDPTGVYGHNLDDIITDRL